MHGDSVWDGDFTLGAVGNEILTYPLLGAYINYAVAYLVGGGIVVPFGSVIIERVALYSHIRAPVRESIGDHHLVVALLLVEHEQSGWNALIITS